MTSARALTRSTVRALVPASLALALACEKAPPSEPAPRPPPLPVPAPVPVVPVDAATVPREPDPSDTSCSFVAIELTPAGTWVGSPPDIRCFAPKLPTGAHDTRWLGQTLAAIHDALAPTCVPPVDLVGDDALPYAVVVDTLEATRGAQFSQIGFRVTGPGRMRFDPAARGPRQCARPVPVVTVRAGQPSSPIVDQVLDTAKQAGFDDVQFAIPPKRP